MTQMVEFELAKILERLEEKVERVIEAQIRLEGKVSNIDTKIETLQKGQDELKVEQKAIKVEISGWYKWVIGLIVASVLSIGTLILKAFDFFPKHS